MIEQGETAPDFELPDRDGATVRLPELRGVWAEKSMYGRTSWSVQRATFAIGPGGTVAAVIPKASPKKHDEQVLKILVAM